MLMTNLTTCNNSDKNKNNKRMKITSSIQSLEDYIAQNEEVVEFKRMKETC